MSSKFSLAAFFANETTQATQQEESAISELRVNGAIRASEVRVVAPDGSQIGVKKLNEALWLAEQLDLDLVEVAPDSKPPVCRLMDYGKYKYEQSVKQREARKNQTRTSVKELRMKVRIGDHDFDITRRKTKDFLESGDKVKLTIRFRGREQERPEFGRGLLDRLAEEVADYAVVEQTPKLEGRSMSMVLAPSRTQAQKSHAKEQQGQKEGNGHAKDENS